MGATVVCSLYAIPFLDETSVCLTILAQGYCLDRFVFKGTVSKRLDVLTMKTVEWLRPPRTHPNSPDHTGLFVSGSGAWLARWEPSLDDLVIGRESFQSLGGYVLTCMETTRIP